MRPGGDRVYVDAVFGQLQGQHPGEHGKRRLGRGVMSRSLAGGAVYAGGDIDYLAAWPRAIILRAVARQVKKGPLRLVSSTRSHSSVSNSTTGLLGYTAALLTNMSMEPNLRTTSSTISSHRFLGAHISHEHLGLVFAEILGQGNGFFYVLKMASVQHNIGALPQKGQGDGAADSNARSGDQHVFLLKIHDKLLLIGMDEAVNQAVY